MAFENDFSNSLRKCVCNCVKSQGLVQVIRMDFPKGKTEMGTRKK
jgi:hypothetical protein